MTDTNTRAGQAGFSAAELLITLFIGTIFLIAGTQLYITVLNQSTTSDRQSVASSAALAQLNLRTNNIQLYPTTCASLPASQTAYYPYGPYDILQFDFNASCPDATNFPSLRKLTVKATHEGVSASHATFYVQP